MRSRGVSASAEGRCHGQRCKRGLMTRLLTVDHAPVRLESSEASSWLRDRLTGSFVHRAPRRARAAPRAMLRRRPESVEPRIPGGVATRRARLA